MVNEKEWVSQRFAAAFLGMKRESFRQMRLRGTAPLHKKIERTGTRPQIWYNMAELRKCKNRQKNNPLEWRPEFVAKFLGLNINSLNKRRYAGKTPLFTLVDKQVILYCPDSVRELKLKLQQDQLLTSACLSRREVSKKLGIPQRNMAAWAMRSHTGAGPHFIRINKRCCVYPDEAMDRWLERHAKRLNEEHLSLIKSGEFLGVNEAAMHSLYKKNLLTPVEKKGRVYFKKSDLIIYQKNQAEENKRHRSLLTTKEASKMFGVTEDQLRGMRRRRAETSSEKIKGKTFWNPNIKNVIEEFKKRKPSNKSELLTTKEASKMFGVKERRLQYLRDSKLKGPACEKFGRTYYYKPENVKKWINKGKQVTKEKNDLLINTEIAARRLGLSEETLTTLAIYLSGHKNLDAELVFEAKKIEEWSENIEDAYRKITTALSGGDEFVSEEYAVSYLGITKERFHSIQWLLPSIYIEKEKVFYWPAVDRLNLHIKHHLSRISDELGIPFNIPKNKQIVQNPDFSAPISLALNRLADAALANGKTATL